MNIFITCITDKFAAADIIPYVILKLWSNHHTKTFWYWIWNDTYYAYIVVQFYWPNRTIILKFRSIQWSTTFNKILCSSSRFFLTFDTICNYGNKQWMTIKSKQRIKDNYFLFLSWYFTLLCYRFSHRSALLVLNAALNAQQSKWF